MPISRRTLLTHLGSLSAAGLLIGPALAETVPFTPLPTTSQGKGRKAAVVGAGIAGLSAAFELHKAGFEVTLLEARQRVGGRSWTLRGGDRVQHDDGSEQTIAFAEGLYFNPGPARIMSHHRTLLGYCRELGVALEPLINDSRNTLLLPDLKRPAITQRQARQDLKGRLSERLLEHLPEAQKKELHELLLAYGDLDTEGRYQGSLRATEVDFPRLDATATPAPAALDWQRLLDPQLRAALIEDAIPEYAASMFQPVGGMDRIAQAFARHLQGRIRLGAELTSLQTGEQTSQITWREAGREHRLQVDYLIVAIPLPLLATIAHNLPGNVQQVLATRRNQQANKVAWQAPRFWERNEHIYGGLSRLNHEAQLLWYPSDGFNSEHGVLVGAYNQGEVAARFAQRPLAEQYALSRQAVDALHPGQGDSLRAPVTVNWGRIPYSQGSWPLDDDSEPNPLLSQAYGRTWLAGDGVAYGGQEGAADSGRRAVAAILQHAAGAST